MFGFLDSTPRCQSRQVVEVERRVVGSQEPWKDYLRTITNANGRFEERVRIKRTAEYRAKAPLTPLCRRARSTSILVSARAKVITFIGDATPRRGTNFRIYGRVRPAHGGTKVILQTRRNGSWRKTFEQPLSNRSTFSFFPLAGWEGRRAFRVRWPRGDFDHVAGVGRGFVVRTHD